MRSVNVSMKEKRWFTMLTVISMLFLAVVGCSTGSASESTSDAAKGQGEAAAPAAKEEDKTPVKIQYWHSHAEAQEEGLTYMIEEFHKKYPYITVEPVYQGGYGDLHKKLLAAVAANDVPAVTNVEVSSLPMFAHDGIFEDLTSYIERDQVDMSSFSEGMAKAYAYEDRQFGFPLIVSMSVMVYNKTMLDKLGVTPPQTWDEVEAFNKKVTVKKDGKTDRYALSVPGWDNWYYDPWMINGGGSVLNADMTQASIDSPESLRYIQNFNRWVDEGAMHIGYGKGASGTMRQMFLESKIAIIEHTSAMIKTYVENADFEVGVSFLPGDKTRISNIGGAGIVMMSGAKDNQKEAAWKFIQFMTSKEYNIKWAEKVGYLPTHKSVVDTEEGKAYQERWPQYKVVLENFDNVQPRIQHPLYPEFSDFYIEAVGKMVLEHGDPAQLMKEAAAEINKVLEESN